MWFCPIQILRTYFSVIPSFYRQHLLIRQSEINIAQIPAEIFSPYFGICSQQAHHYANKGKLWPGNRKSQ